MWESAPVIVTGPEAASLHLPGPIRGFAAVAEAGRSRPAAAAAEGRRLLFNHTDGPVRINHPLMTSNTS